MRQAYEAAGITDYSPHGLCGVPRNRHAGRRSHRGVGRRASLRALEGGLHWVCQAQPRALRRCVGADIPLIKSVLALEHRTIPPNIKFTAPNPKIPFDASGLVVPTELTPWPTSRHGES